jgi:hypothetical protein
MQNMKFKEGLDVWNLNTLFIEETKEGEITGNFRGVVNDF